VSHPASLLSLRLTIAQGWGITLRHFFSTMGCMSIAGVFPDMSLKATYSLFTSCLEGGFSEVQ
jgi:hypothetical protein